MYARPLRSNELYHHGILGMHWGIRRFQNKDGSYTNAGRNRYGVGNSSKQTNTNKKIGDHISKALKSIQSNYTTLQAKEYRKKYPNMSKEEAKEISKKKYDMLKKAAIVGAAAGLTVGAIAVSRYVGRNYINHVIKAGTTIQTLSADPDRLKAGKAFFTSFKEKDKRIYEMLFSHGGKNALQATVNEDIRVAGRHAGQKVYKELLKTNPEFAKLASEIDANLAASRRVGSTSSKLAYDRFNYRSLGVGESSQVTSEANKIFFEALKKKGFGAVLDVNDTKYSNLRATAPVVFFDVDKLSNLKNNGPVSDAARQQATQIISKHYKRILALDELAYNPEYASKMAANAAIIAASTTAVGVEAGYDLYVRDKYGKKTKTPKTTRTTRTYVDPTSGEKWKIY